MNPRTFRAISGNASLILASIVQTPQKPVGVVHASIGMGYDLADDVGDDLFDGLTEEGVFVVRASWHGTGEDAEFLVDDIRPLDSTERACIQADRDLGAAVIAWLEGEWSDASCQCGRPGRDHAAHAAGIGFGACPQEVG